MELKKAIAEITGFRNVDELTKKKSNVSQLERILGEFRRELPEELKEYILTYVPESDCYFDTVGNAICLYGVNRLKKQQQGYNFNPVSQEGIEGWPEHYFILADMGGDPIVLDLESLTSGVQLLTHGTGSWDYGETIADSIGHFLCCITAQHHALNGFEEESIFDDENGFQLAPEAATWYFPKMRRLAGSYYDYWCSIFENA